MAKFWDQVREDDRGCWIWQGRQIKGYGTASMGRLAHRVAYQEMVGDIPTGLELDHLCRTPLCVNPDHLEPVTRDENRRRHIATITHCKHGHEFTPENTYLRDGYRRQCRACNREQVRRYSERKRLVQT